MKSIRKCLAMFLTCILLIGCFPFASLSVSAAEYRENGVTYSYNEETKTAIIIGYESQGTADEVVIPETVQDCTVSGVGFCAFKDANIVSISLPDTIKTISNFAFDGCNNLETVNMNAELTSIGIASFRRCYKLTSINLGNSLETLGSTAFKESGLVEITIPDTCETVGGTAFMMCSALEKVRLSSSLKTIEEKLFEDCVSLKEIVIPDGVTEICSDAFRRCASLEKVVMGNKVESIGLRAFSGCKSLKDLKLSNAIEEIGISAFFDCNSLEEINLPASILSIDHKAFRDCKKLNTIYFSDGIESIGDRVFMGCDSIRNVVIPASVKFISDTAFFYAGDFTIYGVKDSVAHEYAIDKGYDFMGYEIGEDGFASLTCFYGKNVTDVIVPETLAGATVKSIADEAFRGNEKIKSVTMSSEISYIGDFAFEGCSNLENVVFAADSTHIGKYAFANCQNITSVCLPDNIATIDEGAFGYISSDEGFIPSDEFGVYAGINTYGQEYAKANNVEYRFGILKEVATGKNVFGLNYTENSYETGDEYWLINVLGDVNFDGYINVKDATHIQKACASILVIDEADVYLADTTLDGSVNVRDATQIQKYAASIIDSFYK